MKSSSDIIPLIIVGLIFCLLIYLAYRTFLQKSFSIVPKEQLPAVSYDEQKQRIQEIKEQQERFRRDTQQRMRDLRR